jgi:alpha-1,3-glucan synthase
VKWGLKQIGRLPNPDPSDTEPWNPVEEAKQLTIVDPSFESSRGALRKQAQEWAGLDIDPAAELFVFVGRWSNQKGVDLIADVFPAVLERNSKVQLICIGPVIDLYGKFAALKLAQTMKKYPGRVYSKPEFTALPPFIFTGAEFALIPSRDEPFGLVAVEFGRKGALGVGARVGGLGQMPGWWFTVESTTTKHLHHQFKKSIEDALASKTEVRAMMRARSAKQRFPVAKWVEDLNGIQSTVIKLHQEEAGSIGVKRLRLPSHSRLRFHSRSRSRDVSSERPSLDRPEPALEEVSLMNASDAHSSGLNRTLSLGVRTGPGHRRSLTDELDSEDLTGIDESDYNDQEDVDVPGEFTITLEQAEASMGSESANRAVHQLGRNHSYGENSLPQIPLQSRSPNRGRTSSRSSGLPAPLLLSQNRGRSNTPRSSPGSSPDSRGTIRRRLEVGSPLPTPLPTPPGLRSSSVLSLAEVTGSRKDYSLQKVDPTFNDTNGKYYQNFEEMIRNLEGKNSETDLCIEEYLIKSEKEWYKKMRDAKLGRSKDPSPNPSRFDPERSSSPFGSRPPTPMSRPSTSHEPVSEYSNEFDEDEFLLGDNYKRESFLKRWMLTRIGDWPIYSLLLALGQIIAANSYQITLLTGGQGETNEKLYIVGGVYIITSCMWWLLFRSVKSVYVLSIPFLFYGLAFLFVGILQFLPAGVSQDTMRNAATGMYVTASSSGSLFFALNFGDEGKSLLSNPSMSMCSLIFYRRCAY